MIVFLCADDYSNVGNNWARAMSEMGNEAVCLKTQKSAFMQPQTHTQRCEAHQITEVLRSQNATRVVIMHSYHRYIEYIPTDIPYWVMHGGTRYRQNPEHIAAVFAKAKGHIIQTPDLLNLVPGQKERFVPAYVPDTGYKPVPRHVKRFSHYPSNQANKGTADIRRMVAAIGWTEHLQVDTTPLPWQKNQERIMNSQVYIELYSPCQGQRPYGTFGVTALEAALMGRPVITQCLNFNKSFGSRLWEYDPLELTYSEDDFIDAIHRYGRMSYEQVVKCGMMAREATLRRLTADRITRELIKAMQ